MVRSSATTRTYFFCWMTAKDALDQATQAGFPPLTLRMVAGVFSAFTVEAYMNHLGQQRISGWKLIERKLGPREKLAFLQEALNFKVDDSRRPYQTFGHMLAVRDALAHGKTEPVMVEKIVRDPDDRSARDTDPKWKQLCALSTVSRMVEDAERIVRDLACWDARHGTPEWDPFSPYSVARSTVTELRDEE